MVKAKIVKGVPLCPNCKNGYDAIVDYGIIRGKKGFWFSFVCKHCTTKKKKFKVMYETDENFKVLKGR